MADFVKTMKDWKRMCNAMEEAHPNNPCDICLLKEWGCPTIYEDDGGIDYAVLEERIEAWAAEHPEPVYPTWEAYLADLMTLDMKFGRTDNPNSVENYMRKTSIPTDIAQKLGIEPKEG